MPSEARLYPRQGGTEILITNELTWPLLDGGECGEKPPRVSCPFSFTWVTGKRFEKAT